MKDDKFDSEIKKVFQEFEGHDDPTEGWSQMNARLDKEMLASQDEEDFDQSIRSHIESYSIPVAEKDWEKLNSDLNFAQERKEKILISKAIEIATILLLIVTISKYKTLTTQHIDIDPVFMATLVDSDINHDIPLELESRASSDKELAHNALNLQKTSKVFALSLSKNANSYSNNRTISSPKSNMLEYAFLSKDINSIPHISIASFRVQSLPIKPLTVNINLPVAPFLDIQFALDNGENYFRDGWSLGVSASEDINFFNTNFNVSHLRTQLNNDLSGKSIGISASYRKKALEIETGVKYSAKRFAPGLVSYTPASTKSFLLDELDEAKIKQVQIPMIAKLYASSYKNISFYGMAGIAVNVILDMDYEISKSIQANARPSSLPHVDALDLKKLPKGFAQGGDIHDNIYLTGMIGMGVQYHMTNQIGLYIQPQYQHSLSKNINPVVSSINTLSLVAGVKYKL